MLGKKIGIVLAILLVTVTTVACTKEEKVDFKSLETDFIASAKEYYENNIKGMVIGINNHEVSLASLKSAGVDIEKYTSARCEETSTVLIKTTLDDENNVVGDPVYEVNLDCAGYIK